MEKAQCQSYAKQKLRFRGLGFLPFLLLRPLDGHANFLTGLLDVLQNLAGTGAGGLVTALELFVSFTKLIIELP